MLRTLLQITPGKKATIHQVTTIDSTLSVVKYQDIGSLQADLKQGEEKLKYINLRN